MWDSRPHNRFQNVPCVRFDLARFASKEKARTSGYSLLHTTPTHEVAMISGGLISGASKRQAVARLSTTCRMPGISHPWYVQILGAIIQLTRECKKGKRDIPVVIYGLMLTKSF